MGIPLIMVLNIIRITTVLAVGYNFGEDLALQEFHLVGATVLIVFWHSSVAGYN
jgi:exosortase/archaeosortase family protein